MSKKKYWNVLKHAGKGFVEDNCFKLSASLSYYTIFALGPFLIIVISLAGIFFGRVAVEGRLYHQLHDLVGNEAALQIQSIIQNIQQSDSGTVGAVVGAIVLFIGATGVFTEMQDSINYIWSVRAKPKKSWLKFIINRLLSFSLIVGMSFLLLVSLIANAILNLLSDKLMLLQQMSSFTVTLVLFANTMIILLVISGLFTVIYKILPDAVIAWKDAIIGAIFTAILFLLGKFLINFYLGNANLGVTYGTAASIIIILSWVYYTSLILYFGAEFTKMYALQAGEGIRPKETAVFIIKKEAKEITSSRLEM